MATFLVLPPRECLEHALAEFLTRTLPGIPAHPRFWDEFIQLMTSSDEVFVVHREELPGVGELLDDLVQEFGAEPGDSVLEVSLATRTQSAQLRSSVVPPIPDRFVVA